MPQEEKVYIHDTTYCQCVDMPKNVPIRDVRFQVTHACNQNCPHCFSSSGKMLKDELTIKEARKLVDQLKRLGMKLFTLTGGEPLLRKNFVLELVSYLSRQGVYSRLFTNGYLLDAKLARELKKARLNELQVSLDGLESTHDDFRAVRNSFKHAIEAMKLSKSEGIATFARITVIPQNVSELPQVIDLLESLNIDGVRVRPFVSVGRGKDNRRFILSPEDYDKAFGYLAEKRRKSAMNIQLLSPSFSFLFDEELDSAVLKNTFNGKGCSCGTELCAITPDGNLKACGYFSNNLGNVRKVPIAKLWNEHEFVCRMRNIARFSEICMKCKYLAVCGGGCRASAFENMGSFEAPDPLCPLYVKALREGRITADGKELG